MEQKTGGNARVGVLVHKYRHLLAVLGIVLAAAAAFVFVGIDTLPYAQSKTQRVIVNDDYSVLTQAIVDREGVVQQLQVKQGTTLHGVSVNIATFARVVWGTVYAQLQTEKGDVVASASAEMVRLKDNTFFAFLFDRPVECGKDTELYLHIYTEPQTPEDRIALWKSETSYEGFSLKENGRDVPGTIAVQYTTEHVGQDIVRYYLLLFVLAVLAMAVVYLLAWGMNAKVETLFLAAALLVGSIFALFTPIGGAPDEYVHIASAYKMSNRMLGVEEQGGWGTVTVRACDADDSMTTTVDYDSFSFQKIWQGLTDGAPEDESLTVIEARSADVFPLQYLAQALGITLARLLHLGYVWLIVLGRLGNLLAYTVVCYWAVRLTPVFKTMLALCALLPMSLQLAGSFSYDAYVLHLAFLGIALVFRMAYGEETIRWHHLVVCGVVFALLSPAKVVYILLALSVFIIPTARLGGSSKKALAAKSAVFAAVLALWAVANIGTVLHALGISFVRAEAEGAPAVVSVQEQTAVNAPAADGQEETVRYPFDSMELPADDAPIYYDPDSDILPNGDSRYYYSARYILQNPGKTLRLIVHTIATESGKYVQSILGTRLGELIVVDLSASWIWGILLLLLLLLSVTMQQGQNPVHTGLRRWWGVLIFIGIVAATVLACIMWTPINYTTIFGVQGRYFLPALPLLVAALQTRTVRLQRSLDRWLIFGIVPVDLLILLNVFRLMALRV